MSSTAPLTRDQIAELAVLGDYLDMSDIALTPVDAQTYLESAQRARKLLSRVQRRHDIEPLLDDADRLLAQLRGRVL